MYDQRNDGVWQSRAPRDASLEPVSGRQCAGAVLRPVQGRVTMRYVQYRSAGEVRTGALSDGGQFVVNLQAAAAAYLRDRGDSLAADEAAIRIPASVAELVQGGSRSELLASAAFEYASASLGPIRDALVLRRSAVRLEVPLVPRLIVCGGGNFWGHLRESGRERPERVEFFLKNPSVLGPEDDIPHQPWISQKLDYEAELGIVIGKRGRRIPRKRALEHVFGYTAVNDMAIRDRQLVNWKGPYFHVKYGGGKIFDFNFVLGPALVTADEVTNPMDLSIRCWVDGQLRQDSNTSEYIWGVAEVIEYYSSMMTLEPGVLICPGTPGGCAVGSDPSCGGRTTGSMPAGSEYLRPGQTVAVEVGGVGRFENRVRAALPAAPPFSAPSPGAL